MKQSVKSKSSVKPSPKPSEREIFSYWDGLHTRKVDPLEIQLGLSTIDGFDLDIDAKLMTGSSQEAPRALRRLVEAVRTVFDVPAYQHTPEGDIGLTAGECVQLMWEFSQYIADLKKKPGRLVIFANATAAPVDPSNTGSTSDSSATRPVSPPDAPSSPPPG